MSRSSDEQIMSLEKPFVELQVVQIAYKLQNIQKSIQLWFLQSVQKVIQNIVNSGFQLEDLSKYV